MLQQLVTVTSQLRRQQVVAPLHVGPDQELVLHHDGQREGAPLVLHHLPRELLYLFMVRGADGHRAALGARPKQLGPGLQARRLAHVVAKELQRVYHHAVGGEVLRPLVVADERYGDDEDEEEEEGDEDHEVVLLLQQEARQPDADLRRLRAVGVPVLLPVPLGDLVCQGLVGLGDLDEPGSGQGVVGVLVGVVDEGELAVGLLDVLGGGPGRHLQDIERVKPLDLLLLPKLHHHGIEPNPDDCQHRDLQGEAASRTGAAGPCLPTSRVDLVPHV
mmetsp:Transcript_174176/g.423738  ORF Transcript_174176/g.423738 Transcript_174176/m.423738 type:complete len:275 (+) Transcript_174176:1051-1875(+)